ncbi:P-loop containing nucleoside triphosphate hydrolase protein [Jaminaea rosea]|uniref:P-loop containing nucleoside triphosphate hydrolase protein n=1 Tax=Jaminaea rosea TaxID=1569628 RepID=A0A316UM16_9BASI|nr:P-loop containing nucleoside triphosphate hydrolase protein [Jaminaea rosea]PWN25421.1 P-loop containing nucleoside triphosphate hydrolase protein [Jaminaea rosea]
MGRKNKLPPSRGGQQAKRKQDTGPPVFFKHRREEEQRKMAADLKGKQRENDDAKTSSLLDETVRAAAGSNDSPVASSSTGDAWSQYDHLNGNHPGSTVDSSLRAYGRHLRSLISQSDVLIQLLDARDPLGSRSPSTEALIAAHPGKRLLFVLTKIDLVPKQALEGWLKYLRSLHPTLAFKSNQNLDGKGRASRKLHTQTNASSSSAATSSLEGSTAAHLLQLLKNYARSQPVGMSLTVGIFGPPNVGKSSLINSLVRSRACSVAPRPGETKALQTVLLDRKVRLVDSPGVAMPGAGEGATQDVLRGTVKLELVEDPITPVGEILRRADPVKVTRLYRLPVIEMEQDEEQSAQVNAEPQPMVPDAEAAAPLKQARKVDFQSLRDGSDMEDDDDDDQDRASDMEDDHHSFAPSESSEVPLDAAPSSHSTQGGIGFDPSDPLDFLLRLALTRGKMLRGGKPDVEGAARGVINDWNTGRIRWFVAPPATKQDKAREAREARMAGAGAGVQEQDDEMKPAAVVPSEGQVAPVEEEATVVNGFSAAFDLEGLFAQADAQIFGKSTPATTTPATAPANKQVLQAGDVSASSLGKRGRAGANEEEDQDASEAESEESDSDDEDQPKRMSMHAADESAGKEDDEEMAPRRAAPRHQNANASHDELSTFLSSNSTIPVPRTQASTQTQRPSGGHKPLKRGQRNNNKKGNRRGDSSAGEEPAYLARLAHKASLPANVKKGVGKQAGTYGEEVGGGGGGGSGELGIRGGKRGDERRKKRKMARREERGDGGLSGGFAGVALREEDE